MGDCPMSFDTRAARERADAATEGPWRRFSPDDDIVIANDRWVAEGDNPATALFIAHARTDVVALCDEVDRLRAALAECVIGMGEVLDRGYGSVYLAAARERARVALGEQT